MKGGYGPPAPVTPNLPKQKVTEMDDNIIMSKDQVIEMDDMSQLKDQVIEMDDNMSKDPPERRSSSSIPKNIEVAATRSGYRSFSLYIIVWIMLLLSVIFYIIAVFMITNSSTECMETVLWKFLLASISFNALSGLVRMFISDTTKTSVRVVSSLLGASTHGALAIWGIIAVVQQPDDSTCNTMMESFSIVCIALHFLAVAIHFGLLIHRQFFYMRYLWT
eukprot:93265_1